MNAKKSTQAAAGAKLPIRMHHHAYIVRDHEKTRHFYEDIIGLPLKATWIERTEFDGGTLEYCHTFFCLADGSALAFFNFADPKRYEKYTAESKSMFYHIALAVDEETQEAIRGRCAAENLDMFEYDHGYCKSLYVKDPDDLLVEFTVDPPDVGEINAQQERSAHESLQRWLSGDRKPNNDIRVHA